MSIYDLDPVIPGEGEGDAGCGRLKLTKGREAAGSRQGRGKWHHQSHLAPPCHHTLHSSLPNSPHKAGAGPRATGCAAGPWTKGHRPLHATPRGPWTKGAGRFVPRREAPGSTRRVSSTAHGEGTALLAPWDAGCGNLSLRRRECLGF
jgi:hypothetical protein